MEIFKEQYEFELERKEQLGTSLSLPLAMVSILGGILVFYAQHYPASSNGLTIAFAVFFGLFGIALVSAVYFIFRAYTGFTYQYVASGPDLKQWFDDLVSYYSAEADGRKEAEREFQDGIDIRYIEATGVNATNNQLKAAYLNSASKLLAAATALALLCAVPFFMNSTRNDEKPIKVEVVKLPRLHP